MRERDINRKLFHRGHHEVIAKQFREAIRSTAQAQHGDRMAAVRPTPGLRYTVSGMTALVDLAIELAERFTLDNDDFDPCIWLDRCSPDEELYPLSELWPGVDKQELIDA